MSDQGEEGQVPEPPGLEGRGELPPRPTVRESFRRGLFVRLPTEDDAGEALPAPEQGAPEQPVEETDYSGQTHAEQYPEQVADPYPGWRQAADGSWEAVTPEAQDYSQAYEPAAPEAYPEIDESANFASVAGGEPFVHEETGAEEAPLTETPPLPEKAPPFIPAAEVAPEVVPVAGAAPEVEPDVVPVPEMPEPPEAAPEYAPAAEVEPEVAEPLVPVTPQPLDASAEVSAPVAAEFEPDVAEPVAAEVAPEATPATEDPVAGADLYIPSDVELLEGDMPLYGESENVPPRFAGQGLGEPIFVEFEDLPQTLVGLRRLLPKGTRLTYNFDHERAWVRSSADVDLPSFAERIDASAAEGEAASS
jgi:hypothetical protein